MLKLFKTDILAHSNKVPLIEKKAQMLLVAQSSNGKIQNYYKQCTWLMQIFHCSVLDKTCLRKCVAKVYAIIAYKSLNIVLHIQWKVVLLRNTIACMKELCFLNH